MFETGNRNMGKLRIIYAIGCWVFGIFIGIGHTAFELLPKDARLEGLAQTLREFSLSMPGTQTNVYLLTLGISLTMGLMFVGYGVTNLAILFKTPKDRLPELSFQIINVVFSFAAFLLAWKYLFTIPIALTAIAAACFIFVLIGGQIQKRKILKQ
ncbi:MAG: hypothetical protein L3J32_05660 [Rhizobiaceae bacterium]|nr:hypothetical protein [Rhizobiaceae bacterium]